MAEFTDISPELQAAIQAHLNNFALSWFGPAAGELVRDDLADALLKRLDFAPDAGQQQALQAIAHYLENGKEHSVFILNGAAGTGKTSLMKALVSQFKAQATPCFLLAPTGRAAKVLAKKTGQQATTIHKAIYTLEEVIGPGGQISGFGFVRRRFEADEPHVFIVDEASMIGAMAQKEGTTTVNSLLDDLLAFVFENSGWNRILFVGDGFQLPPVFEIHSAALHPPALEKRGLYVEEISLTQVMRQRGQSGILQMANALRDQLHRQAYRLPDDFELADDIVQIRQLEAALPLYLESYQRQADAVCMVTYSNFWAHRINQRFRKLLFGQNEKFPVPGERMLVVKNHYLNKSDFIANGEEIELIAHDAEIEDYAGLQWLRCEYAYEDLKGRRHIRHGRILFDLLNSKDPGLSPMAYQQLLRARRHAETFGPFDPYLNALHLKYPYAITTHKAQGGEWAQVFVLMEKAYGTDAQYLRWLYTAITRASEQLFLVAAV